MNANITSFVDEIVACQEEEIENAQHVKKEKEEGKSTVAGARAGAGADQSLTAAEIETNHNLVTTTCELFLNDLQTNLDLLVPFLGTIVVIVTIFLIELLFQKIWGEIPLYLDCVQYILFLTILVGIFWYQFIGIIVREAGKRIESAFGLVFVTSSLSSLIFYFTQKNLTAHKIIATFSGAFGIGFFCYFQILRLGSWKTNALLGIQFAFVTSACSYAISSYILFTFATKTAFEEIFFSGICYPIFVVIMGRFIISDFLAYIVARSISNEEREMKVRQIKAAFCFGNITKSAFQGTSQLVLLLFDSNKAFVISIFFSLAAETCGILLNIKVGKELERKIFERKERRLTRVSISNAKVAPCKKDLCTGIAVSEIKNGIQCGEATNAHGRLACILKSWIKSREWKDLLLLLFQAELVAEKVTTIASVTFGLSLFLFTWNQSLFTQTCLRGFALIIMEMVEDIAKRHVLLYFGGIRVPKSLKSVLKNNLLGIITNACIGVAFFKTYVND